MISREKIPPGSDSPRRPTRSGFRNFIASAVGRLRNSPGRIFQRLGTQADSRKHSRVEPLKWATRVVFRHWLPISSRRACESRGACGTRPAEFFNGWARKQIRDGSIKRSSENLIRQRGQRTHLNSRGKSFRSAPLQHKESSCGIKQQKFIPLDRMTPHIAQHRGLATRAAYPIESIGAQHR